MEIFPLISGKLHFVMPSAESVLFVLVDMSVGVYQYWQNWYALRWLFVILHHLARLDVAMFNAILRESANEIPSDPISDPIVDSRVLPIPAGDLSFGSGAQLKNSVHT